MVDIGCKSCTLTVLTLALIAKGRNPKCNGVRKLKWASLDALSLCHRQFEPFWAPRCTVQYSTVLCSASVMQQPYCCVVHMVDIGCKSCTPTVLKLTSHFFSPSRCYTRLQLLFVAQFGLQTAAFNAMHPRSDSLLF